MAASKAVKPDRRGDVDRLQKLAQIGKPRKPPAIIFQPDFQSARLKRRFGLAPRAERRDISRAFSNRGWR